MMPVPSSPFDIKALVQTLDSIERRIILLSEKQDLDYKVLFGKQENILQTLLTAVNGIGIISDENRVDTSTARRSNKRSQIISEQPIYVAEIDASKEAESVPVSLHGSELSISSVPALETFPPEIPCEVPRQVHYSNGTSHELPSRTSPSVRVLQSCFRRFKNRALYAAHLTALGRDITKTKDIFNHFSRPSSVYSGGLHVARQNSAKSQNGHLSEDPSAVTHATNFPHFLSPSDRHGLHVFETCKVLNLKSSRYGHDVKKDSSALGKLRRGWKMFLDRFLGIVEPNVRLGIEGSKLIHPDSPFSQGMQGISACLLMYSALLVPVHLSFWEDDSLNCIGPPTLLFDMFVDIYFCMEVVVHFFLGANVNGRYVDDMKEIFIRYVVANRNFWFDLVTSFPFAWIEWSILQDCVENRTTTLSSVTSLLRVFKMLRFVKILKLQGLLDELLSTRPTSLRFIVLVLTIFLSTHLATCVFWKIKTAVSDPDEFQNFLSDANVAESDTAGVYVVSTYLVFGFLSTIGYSDTPGSTGTGEKCYYIGLMIVGVCMFCTIMTEIQRLIHALTGADREVEEHLTSIIGFFRNYRVPRSLERSVRQWAQLRFMNQRAELARSTIISDLPEELCLALAVCLDRELFSRVHFLSKVQVNVTKVRFIAQLILHLKSTCFRAHHLIASHDAPANRLIIITSGRVKICTPSQRGAGFGEHPLKIFGLKKGDSFGGCSVLGDLRWAGEYGINADFISEEEGSVAYIYTRDILDILEREEFKEIREQIEGFTLEAETCDNDTPCAARTTFHWIRIAKSALDKVSSHKWTGAIAMAKEKQASEVLVEQALQRTRTAHEPVGDMGNPFPAAARVLGRGSSVSHGSSSGAGEPMAQLGHPLGGGSVPMAGMSHQLGGGSVQMAGMGHQLGGGSMPMARMSHQLGGGGVPMAGMRYDVAQIMSRQTSLP